MIQVHLLRIGMLTISVRSRCPVRPARNVAPSSSEGRHRAALLAVERYLPREQSYRSQQPLFPTRIAATRRGSTRTPYRFQPARPGDRKRNAAERAPELASIRGQASIASSWSHRRTGVRNRHTGDVACERFVTARIVIATARTALRLFADLPLNRGICSAEIDVE